MNYYNLPKKDLLVLINKKLDVIVAWTQKYPHDNRMSELVREISGEIDVIEPRHTYKRPMRVIAKHDDKCMCRKRDNWVDPLPYA